MMIKLFLKKTLKNISRIRLTIVILGMSLLLASVLFTVAYNAYEGMIENIEPTAVQRIVTAEITMLSDKGSIIEIEREHDVAGYSDRTVNGLIISNRLVNNSELATAEIAWNNNEGDNVDETIKGYVIRCNGAKDIIEVADRLEASGYNVFSCAVEMKSLMEYASLISSGLLFFSAIMLGFVAMVLFFSLCSATEEELEFVAMLKAIGYTKSKYFIVTLIKSLVPTIGGILAAALLYFPMIQTVKAIMAFNKVENIFGVSIEQLMRSHMICLALIGGIALFEMLTVDIIFVKKSEKNEVYSMLSEANNE